MVRGLNSVRRRLSAAALAIWRQDVIVFRIGHAFTMGDRIWVCTDVGARTICAVPLDDLVSGRDSGPPYSVVEHVIDRYSMDGCSLAPSDWND